MRPSSILRVICIWMFACGPLVADVWYVSASANGKADGTSWSDAVPELVDAIAVAQPGDQIWVAAGVYTPDPLGTDRTLSFDLFPGVHIYGGFAGGECDFSERDWVLNETILSGDLAGDDFAPVACVANPDFTGDTENSHHVVRAIDGGPGTVLDGFIVTGGHAQGPGLDRNGAGIFIDSGSPQIRNCTVVRNRTAEGGLAPDFDGGDGAGIYCINASPTLFNTTVCSNRAGNALGDPVEIGRGGSGGGVALVSADGARLIGCTIRDNRAGRGTDLGVGLWTDGGHGGGVRIESSLGVQLRNCTIEGNRSGRGGFGAGGESGRAGSGGGGYVTDSEIVLDGCTFSVNLTGDAPGVFNGRRTGEGGGLYLSQCPVEIRQSTFIQNATADTFNNDDTDGSGRGGAIFALECPELRVIESTFIENRTGKGGRGSIAASGPSGPGGAIASLETGLLIVSTRFVENRTGDGSPHGTVFCDADSGPGGALWVEGSIPVSVANSVFVGNYTGANGTNCGNIGNGGAIASGLSAATPLAIRNCTIFGNRTGDQLSPGTGGTAGGVFGTAGTTVDNSIIHFNEDLTGFTEGAQITNCVVESSIVQNWSGGGTTVAADPLFVDPVGPDAQTATGDEDLTVQAASLAIDSGNPALVPTDVTDLDGDGDLAESIPYDITGLPRVLGPAGGTADRGAYEYTARRFRLSIDDVAARFDPTTGSASFESIHRLEEHPASLGSPSDISGFQCRWIVDDTILEVVSVVPGADLAALNGGAGPDFIDFVGCDTDFDEVFDVYTVGVTISFSAMDFLIATGAREILVTTSVTHPAALAASAGVVTEIRLQDGPDCGSPMAPGENIISVEGVLTSSAAAIGRASVELFPRELEPRFARGDCNGDDTFDVADAVWLLGYLFPPGGGTPNRLACEDACDTNDEGDLDLSDAVYSLSALFSLGPLPPSPTWPECGSDPTPDGLCCRSAPFCQ